MKILNESAISPLPDEYILVIRLNDDIFISVNGEELISCYSTDPSATKYLILQTAKNLAVILKIQHREVYAIFEDDEDLDDNFGMILSNVIDKLNR